MLDARDPETGEGLSDIDIVDNILTFIGAGHETTALALTWTFFLLSSHPGDRGAHPGRNRRRSPAARRWKRARFPS